MGAADATGERIKEINSRYHDAAAAGYDRKWGIDYGHVGARQVHTKLAKALGHAPGNYARALEVGAGTGYFSINLVRTGTVDRMTATDISAGMLSTLDATASALGLELETARAEAERLPFADASFDLVVGHAVLHHIPDLERAFAEFSRVLAPGGTLAFMGEPSRHGDRLAELPKRVGMLAAPAWRRLVGAPLVSNGSGPESADAGDHGLEMSVDVHVFSPDELQRLALGAGLERVRVTGEELVASAYGWMLRALQGRTDPVDVPLVWHQFAFRSYLALRWLDGTLLEPRLPPGLFYNLLLSAVKPR